MEIKDRMVLAAKLRELWNDLLLNFDIKICTESLEGCSVIDLSVLNLIYENPEIKIKDIITILKAPNSSITNVMNRLTKKGFLERRLDPKDFRSFELKLTESGKSAIEEHIEAQNRLFKELLDGIDENECNTFVEIFNRIVDLKRKK